MQFSMRNRRRRSKVTSEISSKKQAGFQPNGRQRTPAYVVEIEYGAPEDANERPLRAPASLPEPLEAGRISTDPERREKVVKILAEAVYGYLKKRGLLTAQAGHVAESAPLEGQGSEGKILDE
jgi:hypothetical protein